MSNETKQKHTSKTCPVTGARFFMTIELNGVYVDTYGGPFDSYTIPVIDDDGEFCWEHYCHDRGDWVGSEMVPEGMIHPMVKFGQENNFYKTACESINKDNPMAVAENLQEMVSILSKCAPALREAGYKTASKQIEELLTKIQSK